MAEGPPKRSLSAESGEIATSTLAEIYAQQGLLGRALSIYRRMMTRTPDDAEIAGRIAKLEQRITEAGPESTGERVGAAPSEPSENRDRLPWDPPEKLDATTTDETPQAGSEAGSAPILRPRGPIDSEIFQAWLEGR